jgi:hypothetical protein
VPPGVVGLSAMHATAQADAYDGGIDALVETREFFAVRSSIRPRCSARDAGGAEWRLGALIMAFVNDVVQSINWASFELASGDAAGFGDELLRMLACTTSAELAETWRHIENAVFVQDDIFGAAEPTIDVMLAALLDERPEVVRDQILELLFFILHGQAVSDGGLARRCHQKALLGFWLIVGEAVGRDGRAREAAFEVLELLDPTRTDAIRDWLNS